MEKIYKKGFGGKVKDVGGRTVTGYFSTFDFKDSDGDIIIPGAFTKSIQERGINGKNRIFHLWQHWTSDILGKPKILKEDASGLYFETELANTALGNDVLQLYMDGIINEHSIGFQIVKSEQDHASDTQLIKEVKLWEGSTVTWGANENTPATGVKGTKPEEVEEIIKRINKAFDSGKYTDDTFELLQIELNTLADLVKTLKEPPLALDPEPLKLDDVLSEFKKGLRNG